MRCVHLRWWGRWLLPHFHNVKGVVGPRSIGSSGGIARHDHTCDSHVTEIDRPLRAERKRRRGDRGEVPGRVEDVDNNDLARALILNRRERVGNRIPLDSYPKLAASSAEDTSVGALAAGAVAGACTAQEGAVPTSPMTADLTTVTGTGPLPTSITSIPCKKLAGIVSPLIFD